jgi:hypothetical protein
MSNTFEFTYLNDGDFEFEVTAKLTYGLQAPPRNMARFQEPDDEDTIEILSVIDEYGRECLGGMPDREIKKIENYALENVPEYDYEY